MNILVINSGSSSIKFQIINTDDNSVLTKGHVDGVGLNSCLVKLNGDETRVPLKDFDEAISYVLSKLNVALIDAIGHRVVHGGEIFTSSTILNDDAIQKIDDLSELAPLHNPSNVKGIRACAKLLPNLKQVAVFDTSFHQTIPKKAYMYGLPYYYYEKYGIRKYGFHGTSHKYIMQETAKILGKEKVTMISCHIGNGSSITAIKNNLSVDTSMGFTPLEGVVMGTRSGDLDPEIVSYIETKEHLSPAQVRNILNKKSGLLGVAGSSDMRFLREKALAGDLRSQLAIDILAYDIVKYVGAYAGILGPIDAITFTAGLGENAFYLRQKVIEYFIGREVYLDKKRNENNEVLISTDDSTVKVFVIPTNEELMIARETAKLLSF